MAAAELSAKYESVDGKFFVLSLLKRIRANYYGPTGLGFDIGAPGLPCAFEIDRRIRELEASRDPA